MEKGNTQPNSGGIDKISSEEDADQVKTQSKTAQGAEGGQAAKADPKSKAERIDMLDSLLNKTDQIISAQNALKKDVNDIDITEHVITTREQRVQRIRARVDKNVQGCSAKDIDANYKIVLIGDAGVGKTSLLLRFADDIFNANPLSTIGVDFKIKTLKVDSKIIKM